MHQYHVVLFGRLVREFKGEFGRGWLSWWHFLYGTDDVDQVGLPDVFVC